MITRSKKSTPMKDPQEEQCGSSKVITKKRALRDAT
jgi:hypothetical protein